MLRIALLTFTALILYASIGTSQAKITFNVDQADKILEAGAAKEVKAVLTEFDGIIDSLDTPADVAKRVLAARNAFETSKTFPDLPQWNFEQKISAARRSSLFWA